jgi:hypothetical protein
MRHRACVRACERRTAIFTAQPCDAGAGETLDIDVPVQPLRRLVPATVYDEPQPYFVYGGFAFVGLTEPYLHEWGDDWMQDAPQDLVRRPPASHALVWLPCSRRHTPLCSRRARAVLAPAPAVPTSRRPRYQPATCRWSRC